jgi:hypothetical protein
MQVENDTPCEAMALPGYDKDGREIVTVIAKGTFSLVNGQVPEPLGLDDRLPIVMADEYWGEPGRSPVKSESEIAPHKVAADLILLGHAYPPKGCRAKSAKAEFAVGRWRKKATVKSPEAMERIPLHFLERMRGGPKWLRARKPSSGFGFYPKQCKPRLGYGGTYDERWQKERAPFLPSDFDYRFFQCAFPGLICDSYLRGGERIHARGVSTGGRLDSVVPQFRVEVEAFLEDRQEAPQMNLDTLIAMPDEEKLVLIWRSLVVVDGSPATVRGFRIREAGTAPKLKAA